jgi:hypothetical protein
MGDLSTKQFLRQGGTTPAIRDSRQYDATAQERQSAQTALESEISRDKDLQDSPGQDHKDQRKLIADLGSAVFNHDANALSKLVKESSPENLQAAAQKLDQYSQNHRTQIRFGAQPDGALNVYSDFRRAYGDLQREQHTSGITVDKSGSITAREFTTDNNYDAHAGANLVGVSSDQVLQKLGANSAMVMSGDYVSTLGRPGKIWPSQDGPSIWGQGKGYTGAELDKVDQYLKYKANLSDPSVSTWSKTNPIESLVYAIEKETSWKSQGC